MTSYASLRELTILKESNSGDIRNMTRSMHFIHLDAVDLLDTELLTNKKLSGGCARRIRLIDLLAGCSELGLVHPALQGLKKICAED
jgi:hypothetical protein